MIEQIDILTPDPDREPSFGYLPGGAASDECEPDVDGEETLGWTAGVNQSSLGSNTADGDVTALERHGMGFLRSGPEDAEPWLGAPEISASCTAVCLIEGRWCSVRTDQTTWAKGTTDDREDQDEDGTEVDRGEDGDDNGIGDIDGVADQWGQYTGGVHVE